MKSFVWIAGLALFGPLPNAEASIQSHCREKWPGDMRMMMVCMREGRPAKAMSKRYPDYMQKECRKRWKSDYEMVHTCLIMWDERDESIVRDYQAQPSANALPPSRIKADCVSWIRSQGKNTASKLRSSGMMRLITSARSGKNLRLGSF